MVRHGRIHQDGRSALSGLLQQRFQQRYLPLVPQKAGENRIRLQADVLPMRQIRRNIRSQIPDIRLLIARVCREQHRWQRTSLKAHGRQDRQRHCQRTAAKAGQIADAGHARQHGSRPLLLAHGLVSPSRRSVPSAIRRILAPCFQITMAAIRPESTVQKITAAVGILSTHRRKTSVSTGT